MTTTPQEPEGDPTTDHTTEPVQPGQTPEPGSEPDPTGVPASPDADVQG
jgi:hypothetical protein